ncbi:uncharacterized protein LOC129312528 [Prosopis cineraria]|uniref:uncharacterized protein LOC129312528 n=1 Tax=Prosopis cineraria TaxID=364024 RepID=UPI00240F4AFE|nr:uncharacterized protein LOC129312528 [Prosopis cineraria]
MPQISKLLQQMSHARSIFFSLYKASSKRRRTRPKSRNVEWGYTEPRRRSPEVTVIRSHNIMEVQHEDTHRVEPCDICGNVGWPEAIATCSECKVAKQHVYCMKKFVRIVPVDWLCEACHSVDDVVSLEDVENSDISVDPGFDASDDVTEHDEFTDSTSGEIQNTLMTTQQAPHSSAKDQSMEHHQHLDTERKKMPVKASSFSHPPLLSTKAQEEKFNRYFVNKEALESWYVDFSFLYENNFEIRHALEPFSFFLELKHEWSPKVVRAFYSNLTLDVRGTTIKTEVRGTKIVLDCATLASILKLPTIEGPCFTDNPYNVRILEGYDENKYVARILQMEQVPEDFEYRAIVDFPMEHKLLHYVVRHCFFNKSWNSAYASDSEMLMMYYLLEKMDFNLPYFMIHRMTAFARKAAAPLPYGSFVTEILKHFQVHHLDEEERRSPETIGINNLSRMGFMRKDGAWDLHCASNPTSSESEDSLPATPTSHVNFPELVIMERLRHVITENLRHFESFQRKVEKCICRWRDHGKSRRFESLQQQVDECVHQTTAMQEVSISSDT